MIVQRMFSEKNLEQREFNSKSQKKMRRLADSKLGEGRRGAHIFRDEMYLHDKVTNPGRKTILKISDDGAYNITYAPKHGIDPNKARKMNVEASNMDIKNPNEYNFRKNLVAGRDTQTSSRINYAEDMSNVNHRINARSLGKSSLSEEARKLRVKKSIAHHQEVIDALKAKKAKNIKNGKIALGVGAAGLATLGGVAAYKHYKKNKKEKEDK